MVFLAVLVFYWLFWCFSGCCGGFLAVSVVFRLVGRRKCQLGGPNCVDWGGNESVRAPTYKNKIGSEKTEKFEHLFFVAIPMGLFCRNFGLWCPL